MSGEDVGIEATFVAAESAQPPDERMSDEAIAWALDMVREQLDKIADKRMVQLEEFMRETNMENVDKLKLTLTVVFDLRGRPPCEGSSAQQGEGSK